MLTKSNNDGSSRDAAVGRAMKITGTVLIAVGLAWWVLGRASEPGVPFLLMNWHVPAILLGLFLRYRGKQHAARSLPAETLDDSRPPVVYLRPFKKDASTVARVLPGLLTPGLPLYTFSTLEEQLSEAVRPIGPLVALARPGAALPKPGAARFHAADDEWRDFVIDLLGKARLVVLRPGETEALMWEIDKAFEILEPGQLLILFHRTAKKEYDAFSSSIEQSVGVALPAYKTVRKGFALVAFGDDWKPRFLPLKIPFLRRSTYKPLRRLFNHALEPVFRDLGVDWHPSPISALTIVGMFLAALLVLFFVSFAFMD